MTLAVQEVNCKFAFHSINLKEAAVDQPKYCIYAFGKLVISISPCISIRNIGYADVLCCNYSGRRKYQTAVRVQDSSSDFNLDAFPEPSLFAEQLNRRLLVQNWCET